MQPLFDAIQANQSEDVAKILQAHPEWADARQPNGLSALSLAVYLGRSPLIDLIRRYRKHIDLWEACMLGDESAVRAEIDGGKDINAFAPDGFTALGLAVYFGRTTVTKLLLAAGADVNARARNAQLVGPIHAAVSRNDLTTLELLLVHGADPNLPQQQEVYPLHVAAANGSAAAVGLLLLFGARANVTTEAGKQPSDFAREKGHEALANQLKKREEMTA